MSSDDSPQVPELGEARTDGLIVLTYHRVGDPTTTAFDPWVFTVDAEQLEAQIRFFQGRHRLVGLEEALEIASGRRRSPGLAVLLTFDDGYLDNYEVALPVLRSLGVEAVFFLTTGFLGGSAIAWWDRMAWLVRSAKERCFRLPQGGGITELDLRDQSAPDAIKLVLDLYKACSAEDAPRFVESLEAAPRTDEHPPRERLFLGPDEARALSAAGMSIGAHSHNHPILARLSPQAQLQELRLSRAILEGEMGSPVEVLAYPVGGPEDFTPVTRAMAQGCGYRAAFSCYGGVNPPGGCDLYDIKRVPVYWGAQPEWLLGL